mgnify:FL=1
MYINETQKRLLDALNQRKSLKLSNGIEVKAVDSRTTVLTVDGEKFAEVVYQNDFLDDVTSNKTNFLMEEILTCVVDSIRATRYKQFLDKVVFSNLLGCGVVYDDSVTVIKVAQVPVAFWPISTIIVLYKHRGFMNTTSIAEIKGLQNKLRYITVDMEDRAVCDDQQYNELVRKFTDLIEFTDYKVDIADLLSALHDAMTNFEMYD